MRHSAEEERPDSRNAFSGREEIERFGDERNPRHVPHLRVRGGATRNLDDGTGNISNSVFTYSVRDVNAPADLVNPLRGAL